MANNKVSATSAMIFKNLNAYFLKDLFLMYHKLSFIISVITRVTTAVVIKSQDFKVFKLQK